MTAKATATPKLIVVEGFPGSGKTTMATTVKQWLDERGIANHVFLEGDWHHPADYESVAYFNSTAYADLLERYPEWREGLNQCCTSKGDDRFIGYWLVKDNHPIPDALFDELAQQDIYEQPDFLLQARLIRERWREFTTTALAGDAVYIFECCLLQNPLTMTILQHNLPDAESRHYIQSLLESIEPLNPVILYLYQQDLRASLEAIAAERPLAWRDAVGDYVNRGTYAQATGHKGFEGYIKAAKPRQAIELALLRETPITHAVLDVSARDRVAAQAAVHALLEKAFIQS